jgi:hypothetical protein
MKKLMEGFAASGGKGGDQLLIRWLGSVIGGADG